MEWLGQQIGQFVEFSKEHWGIITALAILIVVSMMGALAGRIRSRGFRGWGFLETIFVLIIVGFALTYYFVMYQ